MSDEVDEHGSLRKYSAHRPDRNNPGGLFSNYNLDGSRRPDDEDDEEAISEEVFPPFNQESTIKERPINRRKIKGTDIKIEQSNSNRFSISNDCYLVYHTIQEEDDDGNTVIVIGIDTFQCDSNMHKTIRKGDGRVLMNAFLYHYLSKNRIRRNTNVQIALTAVSPNDQTKLNQYYRDIGFQQLNSFPNFADFRGNINDVLHYTEQYIKNAKGTRRPRKSKKQKRTKTNRRH